MVTDRFFERSAKKTTEVMPAGFAGEAEGLEQRPTEAATQRFNVITGHVRNQCEWYMILVQSPGLQPVERLFRTKLVCQLNVARNVSAPGMHKEERRPVATALPKSE